MRLTRLLFGAALAAAFAFGLMVGSGTATAASSDYTAKAAPGDGSFVAPDMGPGQAIAPEDLTAIRELTTAIEPHLVVGDDGLVSLPDDVTADELGVTPEFLANFRAALDYSNEAIAAGDIVVHDDLTVKATERLNTAVNRGDFNRPGLGRAVLPGRPIQGDASVASLDADAAPAAVDGPVPEWGAWGYTNGAIFYNSYRDWQHYRNAYYGLCNTMAAYLGNPWMSRSLIYLYGYNQHYFNQYCYNPAGVYYYLPYSYCRSGFGYKPGYYWTRQYAFNYRCGCYQYQWAWQGFWLRY